MVLIEIPVKSGVKRVEVQENDPILQREFVVIVDKNKPAIKDKDSEIEALKQRIKELEEQLDVGISSEELKGKGKTKVKSIKEVNSELEDSKPEGEN